ncbi:CDP-alcohol phosphatidyltransferase family protein [Amaricoccus sp.]|uniref:CDP-alcohol phosphatidyltransferase family protein n=1 Tax=Amaricoccus sp. TaxID=1872485 RepID=UPI001B72E3F6|nr:CDP-alcohol phosphatidyltransferase family protein [Amaricoccus sp.]MBP7243265.1 CDP-alcohol phosphatidyltransferase family protein [Amaricoccus sp.]
MPPLPNVAPPAARRPLTTRDARWAKALAASLARAGVNPNWISFASLLFAGAGVWAFTLLGAATGGTRVALALAAATTIQLRLLANLLDGLVAVEHGRKQATGDLWNEVPDRVADVAFFLGAGYGLAGLGTTIGGAALGPILGWSAAALALTTAYVRQLGGALGLAQDFRGPMAKQQRMFVLTLGALACAMDARLPGPPGTLLAAALGLIVLGAAATFVRRLAGIARALRARAGSG